MSQSTTVGNNNPNNAHFNQIIASGKMSNEIDEIVQFDQEDQKSASNNHNDIGNDLQINVAP